MLNIHKELFEDTNCQLVLGRRFTVGAEDAQVEMTSAKWGEEHQQLQNKLRFNR